MSAFGSAPLHLDPDFHTQTNLPNTNLHSQDPNPMWMNGYGEQDWLGGAPNKTAGGGLRASGRRTTPGNRNELGGAQLANVGVGIEDADYLSSENSDLNSLSGVNSGSQLHYNATTTATPRDSLNSSQGRVSGSGSNSTSTTNDRQALCRPTGRQTPQQVGGHLSKEAAAAGQAKRVKEHEVVGVLKNGRPLEQAACNRKQRSQQHLTDAAGHSISTHSTFGAFKEVTIYTDHQPTQPFSQQQHLGQVRPAGSQQPAAASSQVTKIASQFNSKHQLGRQNPGASQVFVDHQHHGQQQQQQQQSTYRGGQQRIVVHANGADVNQGIIKAAAQKASLAAQKAAQGQPTAEAATMAKSLKQPQQPELHSSAAEDFESNLSKLSILNLETTEL